MDPLPLQDIYGNVLASGVVAAAAQVASLRRSPTSHSKLTGPQWHDLVTVEAIDERLGGERLRRYLLSGEARRLCFELAVAEWLPMNVRDDLHEALRRRILSDLVWLLEMPEVELVKDADRLFGALRNDVAQSVGIRERHSSLESDRDHVELLGAVVDEASKAITQWEILAGGTQRPDLAQLERFERQVRTATSGRLDRLEPPNYDGGQAIKYKDLYVEPSFRTVDDAVLSAGGLRERLGRAVVLGDPGCGKSSFARSVCTALSREGTTTPFLVELRQYAARKRERGVGIVEYLEELLRSSYQVTAPERALEYLFISGRGLIVFDGLDELLDTHDRRDIRDDVHSFCDRFPWASVLATSRTIGYAETPLDDRFLRVELQEFDDRQVGQYVRRWFKLNPGSVELERRPRAETFLEESESVRDLRSNPLLLALMCAIYKRQNYLPKNRAAVYEQCADMLFDRWDRSRHIAVERPIETKLRSALQHLAVWIYEDLVNQGGVTHRALVDHLAAFINDVAIDDEDDARGAAEEIIEFCHGRGWVLVPTGTASNGDELYGFVHRTFLEFYAAGWYATRAQSTTQLADWLLPGVAGSDSSLMVALLAFQLRDTFHHDAGNELLELTLDRSDDTHGQQRDNLLVYAARCLDFFMPRPALTRRLIGAVIRNHLEIARESRAGSDLRVPDSRLLAWRSATVAILDASPDFHGPVVEAVTESVLTGLDEPSTATEAFDFLFYAELIRPVHREGSDLRMNEIRSRIRAEAAPALQRAMEADPLAAYLGVTAKTITPADALQLHGPMVCFIDGWHPVAPNMRTGSLAEGLLMQAMFGPWGDFERRVATAAANAMVASPPPWRVAGPITTPSWLKKQSAEGSSLPTASWISDWRSAELLAVGMLLAASIESMSPSDRRAVHDLIEATAGENTFWWNFRTLVSTLEGDPAAFASQLDERHRAVVEHAGRARVVDVMPAV